MCIAWPLLVIVSIVIISMREKGFYFCQLTQIGCEVISPWDPSCFVTRFWINVLGKVYAFGHEKGGINTFCSSVMCQFDKIEYLHFDVYCRALAEISHLHHIIISFNMFYVSKWKATLLHYLICYTFHFKIPNVFTFCK